MDELDERLELADVDRVGDTDELAARSRDTDVELDEWLELERSEEFNELDELRAFSLAMCGADGSVSPLELASSVDADSLALLW